MINEKVFHVTAFHFSQECINKLLFFQIWSRNDCVTLAIGEKKREIRIHNSINNSCYLFLLKTTGDGANDVAMIQVNVKLLNHE